VHAVPRLPVANTVDAFRATPSVPPPLVCRIRVKFVGKLVMFEWYELPQPDRLPFEDPDSAGCVVTI
jgi:hypothetical protein